MKSPWCWRKLRTAALVFATLLMGIFGRGEDADYLSRLKAIGLPHLEGKVTAYYSPGPGHREHAERLQRAIEDMNAFYRERLKVETRAPLALLDSKDWMRVSGNSYGLPMVMGTPPVIFMPATSDNPAHGLMDARKAAIPPAALETFLQQQHTTFAEVADIFVDLIGFHELGHDLTDHFGIDPQDRWFSEFLASYWSYGYIAERQPQWKAVFELLGRPSAVRPKNTSLEDFERLYNDVDDYGWYQGMFEMRIVEVYRQAGIGFISAVKKELPQAKKAAGYTLPVEERMKPEVLLERLESISPGFKRWSAEFTPRVVTKPS